MPAPTGASLSPSDGYLPPWCRRSALRAAFVAYEYLIPSFPHRRPYTSTPGVSLLQATIGGLRYLEDERARARERGRERGHAKSPPPSMTYLAGAFCGDAPYERGPFPWFVSLEVQHERPATHSSPFLFSCSSSSSSSSSFLAFFSFLFVGRARFRFADTLQEKTVSSSCPSPSALCYYYVAKQAAEYQLSRSGDRFHLVSSLI